MVVLTDRAQAGGSFGDGNIDLMVRNFGKKRRKVLQHSDIFRYIAVASTTTILVSTSLWTSLAKTVGV